MADMKILNDESLTDVTGGAGTEMNGTVIESLPNDTYKIRLDNGKDVTAHRSGKLRVNSINVSCGKEVTVELSPNSSHGRITWTSK